LPVLRQLEYVGLVGLGSQTHASAYSLGLGLETLVEVLAE